MWPDSKLAARIERAFVPIKFMDESAMDIARRYDIQAVPTFVVAAADGELLLKHVGPPFSKPDEAIIWLDAVPPRFKKAEQAEAAAKAKPGDFAAQLELFKLSNELGRAKRAEEAMLAAEKLAGDDDDRKLEIEIARLSVCVGKNRPQDARAIAERLAQALLKRKDPRLPEIGLMICDVLAHGDKHVELRSFIKQVNEMFPGNTNRIQFNVRAAFALMQSGDNQGALKELDAIVAAGPQDDVWVDYAREGRDHLKNKPEPPNGG